MNTLLTLLRYWVSGEDSRLGRQDEWNHGVLMKKSPRVRFCWELSKAVFVLVLSFYLCLGLIHLL